MSLSSMMRTWIVNWSLSVTWFHSSWIDISVEFLSEYNWSVMMSNWNSLLSFLRLLRESNLFSCLMKTETKWLMQRWENFFEFRCSCRNCNLIDQQWTEMMINSILWAKMKTTSRSSFWAAMILFWRFWMILSSRLYFFKMIWFWCRRCLSELFFFLERFSD